MSVNTPIFWVFFVIAIAVFSWNIFRRFRLVTLGKPENRFNPLGKRIRRMLVYGVGQRRVATGRYPFGLNHVIFHAVFWFVGAASIVTLLYGLFPNSVSLSRLPAGAYYTLSFIFDVVWVLILTSVIVALVRRAAFRPAYVLPVKSDALITLGIFTALFIAFFGLHASEIALGSEEAARYMPVSNFTAATFLSGVPAGSLAGYPNFFWWIFAIGTLGFMNYLAITKHMHILTAIPNSFFQSLETVTTQPREEFKKGNIYGVGQVDQFRWKDLFDSYSCTDCGRCSHVCPATNTGKVLDPRLIIHDIKINLLKNGTLLLKAEKPAVPLIGNSEEGTVPVDAIWACTTCGACMEVCPPLIEHVPKIVNMRRNLVEMQARFPQELLALFENMEQRSNPWGIAPSDRAKWASGITTRPFEADKTEYLFYVGCAGAFDARNRQVTLALAKVLDAAGVSWGILGREEMCCGDSLRRLGNEFVFDSMVRKNIKQFQEKGVKKIITQCPHCYSTFKNDYRQYDTELSVRHHTEFINQLIKENRLKLNGSASLGNVVFHDSCYLGRYNEIYDAPRTTIALATGQAPIDMKRSRNNSFCCGAGGGRMWMEESAGKHINIERVEEALRQDPKTICVCCPYCMTMFEDGLKSEKASDKVQVLDLAEIVARALKL
ncbi:MAG: 4Fe-4S dicluster domain-containing protein [Chloroflexi bacterium]|nr:4Fe-4S dicluster domain-containing protein [Chloroflexota bacterium]MBI4268065.1 4Fe-4S dicluster domain-containing protein [Chloroflexota bacterium]